MKRAVQEISAIFHENPYTEDLAAVKRRKLVDKHGFSSLHGVTSLIDYYLKKILDIQMKSLYCQACSIRKHSMTQ